MMGLHIHLNCHFREDIMQPLLGKKTKFTKKLGYKCIYSFKMSCYMLNNPLARDPFPLPVGVRMTLEFSKLACQKTCSIFNAKRKAVN